MSNINLDFVERSQPSLFIHFAYSNVTEEMVSRTLNELDLGNIKEISFKPAVNKKEEHGNSIAVHFDRWFRNPQADKVRQKMISGMSININYNPKSYWKVVAFQQKVKPETQPRVFKKPTITFDDDEDASGFGPKLGVNCSEKQNVAPKVRRDEPRPRPRSEQPRREQPRREPQQPKQVKRPTTPTEAPPVVYKNYIIQPDVFDMNEDITNKGVMLPPPKRRTQKPTQTQAPVSVPEVPVEPLKVKKVNIIVDDTDDEEDEDEESEALYSDLK